MAFGVHILILRFLGDRVGVERVEPGLVARRLPRGVARERTADVLAVGEDLLRVAFAVGQCREGIHVSLGEKFVTGDRQPRPNRRASFVVDGEAPRGPRRMQRPREPAAFYLTRQPERTARRQDTIKL